MPGKLTQEEVIAKFIAAHGYKYDYSKVEYKGTDKPVCIICPIHGEFWQKPVHHQRGCECTKCRHDKLAAINEERRNTAAKEFEEKARKVHGDKYDYSKVEYVNALTNVTIICPIHGEFERRPSDHISTQKQGCPECSRIHRNAKLRRKQEDVIKMFIKVHGDKYDYSKVEYKGWHKKIKIICPIHGEFEQYAGDHRNGCGCSKCDDLKKSQERAFSHEEWVKIIAEKNPGIEVLGRITNSHTPVLCRCNICGREWSPKPIYLSTKQHKCGKTVKLTHREWVDNIKEINPNIEILGEIVNGRTPVPCLCKVCGHRWEPVPSDLSDRHGCPRCANYGFLSHEQGSLYIMVDDVEVPTLMKVGVSVDAEKRRDRVLNSAKKAGAEISDLYVIKTWEGSTKHMQALEKAMHKAFSEYKINFRVKFSGSQEFFYYRPEVFELIEEHLKKLTTEE